MAGSRYRTCCFGKLFPRCRGEGGTRLAPSVVSMAIEHGVAVPAFASSLAYYDGLRRSRGPANLLQWLARWLRLPRPIDGSTRKASFTPAGLKTAPR